MRVTAPGERPADPPGFIGLWVFLALAACWAVAWMCPGAASALATAAPWLARASGYLACLCMLFPYVHILRRFFRGHHGWPAFFWRTRLSWWLRWHIISAYLAFGFLLLHALGKASSPLTFWLTFSVWAVMLSGVAGYYGQRALYRATPSLLKSEMGLERYEAVRASLLALAEGGARPLSGPLLAQGPEPWRENARRLAKMLLERLQRGPAFWVWLAGGLRRDDLPEGDYQSVRAFLPEAEAGSLDGLWGLVQQRALLDWEYRLHQLGRLWLLVHGPASIFLLILMAQHIWLSVLYGGW